MQKFKSKNAKCGAKDHGIEVCKDNDKWHHNTFTSWKCPENCAQTSDESY